MRCISCQEDVPTKFSHAISVNICPFCGSPIMDAALQIALKELKSAMLNTESYAVEIFDWLKSNYNLFTADDISDKVKIAEDKAKANFDKLLEEQIATAKTNQKQQPQFKGPKVELKFDDDGNQINGNPIQPQENTDQFLKRAQISKVVKNNQNKQSHFQDMIKKIKSNGGVDESHSLTLSAADLADIGDVDEMQQSSTGIKAELDAAFGNVQSNTTDSVDYEDDIPDVVAQMAGLSSGGNTNNDIAKLKAMQNKSARATRAMAQGGSVGLIRR